MSAGTSLSASDAQTRVRAGVRHRAHVSATAKAAMLLFARAGAVASVVLYWGGGGSTDTRDVVLVTLTMFWTVLAVILIWTIDGFVRALGVYFNTRQAHSRTSRGRQASRLEEAGIAQRSTAPSPG